MQNITPRERAAVYAILLWLTADLTVAFAGALHIAALGGTGAPWLMASLKAADSFSVIAGIIWVVAYMLSAVCVGRWIYRASANAHAMSEAMTISPGWSIGFFFIPIASLFKPYIALLETWQVSIAPGDPDSVPVSNAMRVWWALWVLSNLLGNTGFHLTATAKTIDDVMVNIVFDIISLVVDVSMAVLLIFLIRRLSANQRALVDTRIFE